MKDILILTGSVLLLAIGFFAYLFYEFNKKEYYYGFVDNKKEDTVLKDKTGDTVRNYILIKDDKTIQRNKWVKVTYTDNKGVVLEQKSIDENKVPKEIRNQFKE